MPAGFQRIPVPRFRKSEIILAELCAIELWQGINYENGKPMPFSDEELMQMFATPVDALYRNPRSRQNITEMDVRSLIRVAKLKALFRSTNPTDFQSGIDALKTTVMPTYRGWRNGKQKLTDVGSATKAVMDWSVTFVQNGSGVSKNGNYRVPLACRILFFAVPDMQVFNFSNGLAKVMNFQSRPQAALPEFNLLLDNGLKTNKLLMAKLKMPKPTTLNIDIWKRARKSGWWKRRVLDLALLLHYRVVVARPHLQSLAAALAKKP